MDVPTETLAFETLKEVNGSNEDVTQSSNTNARPVTCGLMLRKSATEWRQHVAGGAGPRLLVDSHASPGGATELSRNVRSSAAPPGLTDGNADFTNTSHT